MGDETQVEHGVRIEHIEKRLARIDKYIERNIEHSTRIGDQVVHLSERLDAFIDRFEMHDKKEMEKYDVITQKLQRINTLIWIATGVGMTLHYLGFQNWVHRLLG